jgi:hypothetical protein
MEFKPQILLFFTANIIIIIITIIIIWHYNGVFAFSAKSLQFLLSLAVSFPFFDVLTSYISCRWGLNKEKCDVMRNVTIHQLQHSCQG